MLCASVAITRRTRGIPSGAVADLGGAQGARAPPGTQILSISCSFQENLAKSYVGAPPPPGSWRPPGEILDPPLGGVIEFRGVPSKGCGTCLAYPPHPTPHKDTWDDACPPPWEGPGTRYTYPCKRYGAKHMTECVEWMTDRHLWKHYLSATLLAVCKYLVESITSLLNCMWSKSSKVKVGSCHILTIVGLNQIITAYSRI